MFAVIRIFKSAVDALLFSPPSPFFLYLQLWYFACSLIFLISLLQSRYGNVLHDALSFCSQSRCTKLKYHLWKGDREGGKKFGHQFLNLEVSVEIFWQIVCTMKCIKGSNSILASSGWEGNEDKLMGLFIISCLFSLSSNTVATKEPMLILRYAYVCKHQC